MATLQNDTRGRIILVEKDVDTEPGLARQFLVRGTPTFVVLDARGHELGRVPPAFDTRQFEADLECVLARAACVTRRWAGLQQRVQLQATLSGNASQHGYSIVRLFL